MRHSIILIFITIASCNSNSPANGTNNSANPLNADTTNNIVSNNRGLSYKDQLDSTKAFYPFAKWRENYFHGLKQYSQENCDKTKAIFDNLISRLISLGENAEEQDKVMLFKSAVLSLNQLNDEIEGLIETGEREDLSELINHITIASGLDPKNFADGAGIADEWRDW